LIGGRRRFAGATPHLQSTNRRSQVKFARDIPEGEATRRTRALTIVQLVYALACVTVALPLIFTLGPAADVTNGTSVRLLGAALLAFSVGALAVARYPRRNRALLQVEITFTALTALFLMYRLIADHNPNDRAWFLLPPVLIGLALLVLLYPRRPG
jgi:peptidoglycan/LPS O-acetylase OafA/YrhL